jgi:hypothetical protein
MKGTTISQLANQLSQLFSVHSQIEQSKKMSSYTESRKNTIRRDIISVERKIEKMTKENNINNMNLHLFSDKMTPSCILKIQRQIALNDEKIYQLQMRLFSLKERLQLLEENHQVIEILTCICDNIEMKRIFPMRITSAF